MAANPMSQFDVYRIGPEIKVGAFDISFTNASLFMILSTLSILLIFNLGSKKNSILPNKIQLLAELSYTFVSKMISDTAGSKAKPYFAFMFFKTCSGNGFSDVKGPPGALCIKTNEIIINIIIVGIAMASLLRKYLIIKKKHRSNRCFNFYLTILKLY